MNPSFKEVWTASVGRTHRSGTGARRYKQGAWEERNGGALFSQVHCGLCILTWLGILLQR